MRALGAILVALTVFLCAPAAAQAGPWEVGRAMAVASKVWGAPCGGRPVVEYAKADDPLAADYDAWVMFQDINNVPVPECKVNLSPKLRDAPWEKVCRVIIHEYGHLTGIYVHESDPRHTMHESPPDDPRCASRGRPYLGLAEPRTARMRARYN